MSRPWVSRSSRSSGSFVRVNGRIRAREVRVVGADGEQVGVMATEEAMRLARSKGLDLVEVAPKARPPVCRVVDYGKYRYEQSKKQKENKKHQHANRVKEIQLRPSIDPHDYAFKRDHAIEFLCEDMKVKVSLRFRGREMAHKEFGFKIVNQLIDDIAPYGHPDAPPKLVGRGLNVMISPLPRNKRAASPFEHHQEGGTAKSTTNSKDKSGDNQGGKEKEKGDAQASADDDQKGDGFVNNPFSSIDVKQG